MKILPSHLAGALPLTLLLAPGLRAAAADPQRPDASRRIEEILEARRIEQHIPGFAFALVRDDGLELVVVRGLRDVEHALPVTADNDRVLTAAARPASGARRRER